MYFKESGSEIQGINELIAVIGIVILFPGFFIYHLLLATTGMEPLLGGLFGGASLLLTAWYILASLCIPKLQLERLKLFGVFVLAFIAFVVIWSTSHWVLYDQPYVHEAFIQTAEIVILWLALFFIALWLPRDTTQLESLFFYFFIIGLTGLCVFVLVSGSLEFNARRLFSADEHVASYAGFSRSMVIVLLFLVACTLNYLKFFSISVAGVFTLFLLSSRAEFFAFPLAIMALFLVSSQTIKRTLVLSGAIILFIALLVTLVAQFPELTDQNRFFELLKFENSSSWVKRKELQEIALSQIANHPFLGYFGGHIVADSRGGYAHNILSSWVNFGLIGFIWYFLLSLISLLGSAYGLSRETIASDHEGAVAIPWRQSFVFNVFSFALVMFVKSVFWPLMALAWGLYARALYLSNTKSA